MKKVKKGVDLLDAPPLKLEKPDIIDHILHCWYENIPPKMEKCV